MRKGKIVRCSASGNCTPFIHGLGTLPGIKARGDGLWLLSYSNTESALIHYDLPSGRLIQQYAIAGVSHNFNDLTFAPAGDMYLTDTRGGAVWHLAGAAARLEQLPGRFDFANGITVSPDGGLLYVSTFPAGITVVDLKTRVATPIAHPSDLCPSTIDG
jgi:sugar lactone lactonase YvrE